MSRSREQTSGSFLDGYRINGHGEPIALGQSERLATERLKTIVKRQRVVANGGRFAGFKDPLAKFPRDIEYEALIQRLIPYAARLASFDGKKDGLVGSFNGELLERIAYLFLSAKFLGRKVIIPPEDTVRVFSALHPEARFSKGSMQSSLGDVSAPDMIATDLDGVRVTDLIEVSLNPKEKMRTGQIGRFVSEVGRESIFYGAQVVLVHPEMDLHPEFGVKVGLSGREPLPFTIPQFVDFATVMHMEAINRGGLSGLDAGVEIRL